MQAYMQLSDDYVFPLTADLRASCFLFLFCVETTDCEGFSFIKKKRGRLQSLALISAHDRPFPKLLPAILDCVDADSEDPESADHHKMHVVLHMPQQGINYCVCLTLLVTVLLTGCPDGARLKPAGGRRSKSECQRGPAPWHYHRTCAFIGMTQIKHCHMILREESRRLATPDISLPNLELSVREGSYHGSQPG